MEGGRGGWRKHPLRRPTERRERGREGGKEEEDVPVPAPKPQGSYWESRSRAGEA